MRTRLVAFLIGLACAGQPLASEEEFVVWQEVRIVCAERPETGAIVFEARTDGERYAKVSLSVFGKVYTLNEADRLKLGGFPLSSIALTHEAGYAELGGHTVHVKLKRVLYKAGKLVEERVRISVSKGKGLTVHGPEAKEVAMPDAPPAYNPGQVRLKVVEAVVSHAGVEQQCRGRFTVRNVGPDYTVPPHVIGPSYGVFIYDKTEALLFRNFGGWGPGLKAGQDITFGWDTHSNHLGEKSEPAFLIPAPGRYKLVIRLYRGSRDQVLDTATSFFDVKPDQQGPGAEPSAD
ncbi:MAG: hypothetical protein FJ290_05335 [Planctomycetes bacterium]|nr:hypothetical protein [Planctomycetota bacterium]